MNGLDLFTGIGGISLALRNWIRPVAYCEIDSYCQSVLLQRMQEGYLCKAPIWDDVRTLPFEQLPQIDIITAGFPCQDISVAGLGKGLAGERSGLFFEIVRLAKEIKPSFIFLENVPAITSRGGLEVVSKIAKMGYDCRWCVISAASVGALHRRERWFLLAYSKHNGTFTDKNGRSAGKCLAQRAKSEQQKESIGKIKRTNCISSNVAYSSIEGLEGFGSRTCSAGKKKPFSSGCGDNSDTHNQPSQQANPSAESKLSEWYAWREHSGFYWPFVSREHWQETVSEMGKCSDGVPFHVDRLKSLGNSVVPQQVQKAFKILVGFE